MHRIHLPLATSATVAALLLTLPCNADNYALVVGVNTCDNFVVKGNNAPKPLGGAEQDANAFGDLLQGPLYRFKPANVHRRIGNVAVNEKNSIGPATYAAIKQAFDSFKKTLDEDDQFVFYFAGHGTQVLDRFPFDERNADGLDEALCPFDATVVDGLIVDDDLNDWFQSLRARNVTVVVDCCHAGTAAKGGPGAPCDDIRERSAPGPKGAPAGRLNAVVQRAELEPWKDFQQANKGLKKTIVALYACGADEPAIERFFPDLKPPIQQRGQFTQLLIEHLVKPGSSDKLGALSVATKDAIQAWANDPNLNVKSRKLRADAGKQTPTFEPEKEKDRKLILP